MIKILVELQILNKVLNTKDYSIITDNNLSKEYFPKLTNEFNFISTHFKQYNQVPDVETFLKSFPDFEVIDVQESTTYLVDELYKEKNTNYLSTTFNKIRDLIMSGKTDEAMNVLSSASTTASHNKRLEAVDILTDTSRYDIYVDKTKDFGKYYITTGFKELDESFGGGIDRRNAYFVVSARAGYGKTLIMIKMAAAAADRGLKVGFYEGEMSVEKIGNRLDTIISHISNSSINHGRIEVANVYKNFLDNLKENHKGCLYVLTRDMVPENRMTVDVLRSFVDKYELDILFVDQISLLDDSHYAKQTFDQAANISKDLKMLQVQKHIPIVLASQQNRASIEEGKYAGTQNLSLSDRIGQDATDVVFITKEEDILTFNIAKARDGCKQNVLTYQVNFNTCEFSYIPQDDDKLGMEQTEQQSVAPFDYMTYDEEALGDAVF